MEIIIRCSMFSLKFGRLWDGIHYLFIFFGARRREPHGPSFIEQKVKKKENYATKVEVIE